MFLRTVGKPVKQITTGDIRYYLARYMADRKVEKITLDNQRRALSAFLMILLFCEHISENKKIHKHGHKWLCLFVIHILPVLGLAFNTIGGI